MASKKQDNKGNNSNLNAAFTKLVQKADNSLNDDERRVAKTLADFIKAVRTREEKEKQYPTKNSQQKDPFFGLDEEDFKKNPYCKRFFDDSGNSYGLFVILISRMKHWNFKTTDDENQKVDNNLYEKFKQEYDVHIVEGILTTEKTSNPQNFEYNKALIEKVYQMLLCNLYVARQIIDVNDNEEREKLKKEARKKYPEEYTHGNCLYKFIELLQNFSPEGMTLPPTQWQSSYIYKFLYRNLKIRNTKSHGGEVMNRGLHFARDLYAIFAVSAFELTLETETKERVSVLCPDCDITVSCVYNDGETTTQLGKPIPVGMNSPLRFDLEPGEYTFSATEDVEAKRKITKKVTRTIQRGEWLRKSIMVIIYLKTDADEEKTRLEEQVKELKAQSEELERKNQELQARKTDQESDGTEVTAELEEQQKILERIDGERRRLESQKKKLEDDIRRLSSDSASEKKSLDEEKRGLDEEKKKIEDEIRRLNAEREQKNNELEDLQKGLAEEREKIYQEQERLNNELQEIEKTKEIIQDQIQALKEEQERINRSRIKKILDWINLHKLWIAAAVGVLAVLVVGILTQATIHKLAPDRRPEVVVNGGDYPVLDSKVWIVREKNGGKMATGGGNAEINSANFDGTEYRMVVITDLPPEYFSFSYDRKSGKLSSPELGEGHVERGNGIYTLRIVFEGWILEKK